MGQKKNIGPEAEGAIRYTQFEEIMVSFSITQNVEMMLDL